MEQIEFKCSTNTSCKGFNELMVAVVTNNIIRANEILESKKYNINATNDRGMTALYLAARNSGRKEYPCSSENMVELLLRYGADPNVREKNLWSPLHTAAGNSSFNSHSTERTVELLLEHGADPNIQDEDGWTPLHIAAMYSDECSTENTVEILLKYGAYPNIKNNEGNTPIDFARDYSTQRTVELLKNVVSDDIFKKIKKNLTDSEWQRIKHQLSLPTKLH